MQVPLHPLHEAANHLTMQQVASHQRACNLTLC